MSSTATRCGRPAAVVRAEADRLDRLVTDLLDLARVGAQDLRLDLERVDLAALVADAAQVWRDRAARRRTSRSSRELPAGAAVGAHRPDPAAADHRQPRRERAAGDAERERAWCSRARGRAPAATSSSRCATRGPGLTDDDIAVAFEPSALYERYRGVRQVGSGVGLALVARLAERLGGRAEAAREPSGGACLRVVLPGADRTVRARRSPYRCGPNAVSRCRRRRRPQAIGRARPGVSGETACLADDSDDGRADTGEPR